MNTGVLQSMNDCGLIRQVVSEHRGVKSRNHCCFIRQVVSEHRGFIIQETLWSYKAIGL